MATPATRMRLTVEVLSLVAENARGPHQAAALQAFTKSRKFALPVELEHTIEQVWQQIEDRYKRNYLSQLEASCFEIKKLQDAYECDLDVGDTIGAIFEGETDPQMRAIKVVPSFVNRNFSMPPTSNLRPGSKQKRIRETSEERADKRRRLENAQQELMDLEPARDEPIRSIESEYSGGADLGRSSLQAQVNGGRRTKSGSSLVIGENMQTGNTEFMVDIKQESPELGVPRKPATPSRRLAPTPRRQTNDTHERQPLDEFRDEQGTAGDVADENDDTLVDVNSNDSLPEQDSTDAAIRVSPRSTPERNKTVSQESAKERVAREESEAPFMKQSSRPVSRRSYGRTSNVMHTQNHAHQGADLLNHYPSQLADGASKASPAAITPAPRHHSQAPTDTRSSKKPPFMAANMSAFKNARTPQQKSSTSLENLGVQTSQRKRQQSKTPRGRAGSNVANTGTPQSFSTTSTKEPTHTLTAQSGTMESFSRARKHPSPKVIIPVRTPSAQEAIASGRQGSHLVSTVKPPDSRNPAKNTRKAGTKLKSKQTGKQGPGKGTVAASSIPASTEQDVYAVPDSDPSAVPPSSSRTSQSLPKRSKVPLPDNVKHLQGASVDQLKAFKANSAKPGNRNTQAQAGSANEATSAILGRRPGRKAKATSNAIAPAEEEEPSQVAKKPTSNIKSQHKNSTDEAVVLSSRISMSDYPNKDVKEKGGVTGAGNAKTSRLARNHPPINGVKESAGKKHARVMKKIFPDGHEESRREQDPVREVFGERPVDPVSKVIDLHGASEDDVKDRLAPIDTPSQANDAHTVESIEAIEDLGTEEQPPNNLEIERSVKEETATNAVPWNAESWHFGGAGQPSGTAGKEKTTESESDNDDDTGKTKSKSASHADSRRSSPEVSRRPARYLSRSPTPDKTNSEDGSDTSSSPFPCLSRSQSRTKSSKAPNTNGGSDSDDSSDNGDHPIEDADTEDEDTEMPDVDRAGSPVAGAESPSFPPEVSEQAKTLVPARQSSQLASLSQPAPRATPVLLPTNTPAVPATQPTPSGSARGSSQLISQLAAARRTTYSKFLSIRSQLSNMKVKAAAAQKSTTFDPRTSNLSRLARGGPGSKTVDVSSDDESTSESSNEDENAEGNNGGSCSVA
ncbi:hypothetical protein CC80DRAFT_598951 [Byssothecium circinans]|uniref:Nucleolar protein Dnt1-like N-terminal domain-containing protein n=1 Tax=Byssothecium circinans TaxID=147558 RepID=A0A6A5TCG5_9PLEO|nr:hypothetical protein CC80DRAFT_598951 [Byssothecium circinans]